MMPLMAEDHETNRLTLEKAARDPTMCPEADYLLWEVCQACGDRDAALLHLERAIRRNRLRTRPPKDGVTPVRSVLALNAPGDFQANLPLPMLFDSSTTLHTLWLGDGAQPLLPPVDCVFIAIAQDERNGSVLAAADALAAQIGAPVINKGAVVASLSRDSVSRLLAGVPGGLVPSHEAVDRAALGDVPRPFIVRPAFSHAGQRLALVTSRSELALYLSANPDNVFMTAPFVDYRNRDGLFRKYRIIFVDGRPYPLHLAIHDQWAVWYYNARMEDCAGKRAEEARFLTDMAAYLGPSAIRALDAIAERVRLDYFGLDCAVLDDGRLLVFEIETGMIVHDHDTAPAKRRAARRILRAVEGMIDARVRAWRAPWRPVRAPNGASASHA